MHTKRSTRRTERLTAEHERQRGQILDAGLRVFASRSYREASVHDVAAEAGFSVGHIYNLIGNKATLYDAVIARELRELETALRVVIDEPQAGPAIHRIDRLIDVVLEFFHRHRLFFQIHLNETGGLVTEDKPSLSEAGRKWRRRMKGRVLGLFEEAAASGDMVDLDPGDLMLAFEDHLHGFIARWAVRGYRGDVRTKAPVIRRILWTGMAASPTFRRRVS